MWSVVTDPIRTLVARVIHHFIHKDFHEAVARMTIIDAFLFILLKPDPMMVATKLLARRTYKDTGKQFNVIAASWIQFMIHDWIDHLEDTNQIELTAPREVASHAHSNLFKFYTTKEFPTGFYEIKSGASNIRTPWW
ncbi:Alpha-dioxygenase 1 [Spatholobus suberectus]|nr:Alpha-dioxygenase 1 [Spatholobus suberectus]